MKVALSILPALATDTYRVGHSYNVVIGTSQVAQSILATISKTNNSSAFFGANTLLLTGVWTPTEPGTYTCQVVADGTQPPAFVVVVGT